MRFYQHIQSSFFSACLFVAAHVSPEVVGLDKALATVLADVGFLIGVLLSDVLLHVGILGKPHPTPGAHVGLHPAVQQLVAHQVVLEFELFMADITVIVSLRFMSQFVPVQSSSLSEFLPTKVTHVRLLSTVNI